MEKYLIRKQNDGFQMNWRDADSWDVKYLEHSHDAFEIAFFLNADIRIFIKNRQYTITDGDLLFMSEHEIHKIVYTKDRKYKRHVIFFKRQYIEDVLRSLGYSTLLDELCASENRKLKASIKQKELITEYIKRMDQNLVKLETDDLLEYRAGIKLDLASFLIFIYKNLGNDKKDTPAPKNDALIKDMIRFIDENYTDPPDLDALEKKFNLCKYHICRLFKRTTGFSFIQYLQLKKIVEAKKLLSDPDKQLSQICFDCGFSSIQHFFRVFKQHTGTTPHRYRKDIQIR